MRVIETKFPEVKVIEFGKSEGVRGLKVTTLSECTMKACGIEFKCVQQNIYHAPYKGTYFGIHFQDHKHPQAKLIYCLSGRGMDYVVDLRKDSPTYKEWIAIEIQESDDYHIYIPQGFGHAFLTLEDDTRQLFSIDEYFYPESSKQIRYDDPQIHIEYPVPLMKIAEHDIKAPYLSELDFEV